MKATSTPERRASSRIDKVFRVLLSTEELGEQWYVARNISQTGMFVEMAQPLPLNARVVVRFTDQTPSSQDSDTPAAICAMARIQNHYYLQFSDSEGLRALCGVGLRFLRFVAEAGAVPPTEQLH